MWLLAWGCGLDMTFGHAVAVMGILAIGPFTGAALNPARWFGPAVVSEITLTSGLSWKWLSIGYVLGPVTGAVLAAFVYQLFIVSREQLVEESA